MKTFDDLDVTILRAFAETLRPKCPEAVIRSPTELANEDARASLVFKAGRASVLREVEDAIKRKERGE